MRYKHSYSRIVFTLLFASGGLTLAEESHHGSTGGAASSERVDAGHHIHGSHPECPIPQTAMDVVRCAQNEHPEIKRALLSQVYSRSLTGVARQLPNPELDVQAATGRVDGTKRTDTQFALVQPIELGGKRAARSKEAEAQIGQVSAGLASRQAEVIVTTILNLHRLRQLEQEKEILQETVDTYKAVIQQQGSRPGLTPELRVSLSVFRMALAEARIRQSELFEEEKKLEHYFHITTGHSLAELQKVLPVAPTSWPKLDVAADEIKSGLSPGLLMGQAEIQLSTAQLAQAQSEAWPTMSVGPLIQFEEGFEGRGTIFGFQLSMPIPLWQTNGAGRALAAQGLTRSERLMDLVRAEESHERAEQVRVYQRTVQTLKDSPSPESLEREHRQNESYARRGLVSAALMVESHRSLGELTRGRHGQELKALEALWLVYKFDGRIFSESL